MDQNSHVIDDFEDLLQKRLSKAPPALYSNSDHIRETQNTLNSSKLCSAKEVLANVAKQIKAIQNADTMSYKRVGGKLDKYKKREFLTVDMIPVHSEVPQNIPTKFETQCVTDTQLINVIENAEIVDRNRGITQEFDETFCQKDDNDSDVKLNDASLKTDEITDVIDKIEDINVDRKVNDLNEKDSKLSENSDFITCEMDTITYCQSDIDTANDEINEIISQDVEFNKCTAMYEPKDRSASPVLTNNRRKSISPLVVSLYTFENFENLAHPILEEQEDLEVAKNLINSQIVGRELCIPGISYENIDMESPIFGKIECITTNIEKDDLYVDEDVNKDDSKNEGRSRSATSNTISENKKKGSSIKITDIKDEILFSSDEEYEYLHKDVQELPLTCALETSFYDTSNVLDKTMYVGFQTASNKSIQIQTDSFYKAKSFLNIIDNEGTETTLSDLVDIFDSSKAVSENVHSVNLNNDTKNSDTHNKTSSKIEHTDNTKLPSISENNIEQEQKKGDTFQNVCLTELEQNGSVNDDDIVMSQIIELKSISRSTKSNNIITQKEKVNDTLNNVALTALEHDNQMDDDVPMSQIIEFKSITRTPKYIENVSNTDIDSVNVVFARPADVAKRKFEGFKTASNKKIKLSDKSLALCKKVFQDIDLNDTEDKNCESIHKTADDCDNEDLKSRVLGVSRGCLKTTLELSHNTKQSVNDIHRLCHSASAEIDEESNDRRKISDLNVQERKAKLDDVDFQINEQILREFEDNDMPFEEKYNNISSGFKTAYNKNIAISNIGMTKSRHLFQDIVTINEENGYDNMFKTAESDDEKYQRVFKKPSANLKKVSDKILETSNETSAEAKSTLHSNFDREIPTDVEKDCERDNANMDRKITNHVENELDCGIDTQDFFGEDLTRIEDFFKDNETNIEKLESAIFKGFQTASKKVIVISEIAMEKSKNMFEDLTNRELDCEFQINNVKSKQECEYKEKNKSQNSADPYVDYDKSVETQSKGFVVTTCKVRSTVKSQKPINELDFKDTSTNAEAHKFLGFQTASAKPIHISAAAIERTKKMLSEFEVAEISADYDQPSNPKPSTSTFVGFQTASNKQIKISAKALAKSKELLNDLELKNDFDKAHSVTSVKDIHNISNNTCVPSASKFVGFQTASNKEVNISNDYLVKSKEIFQDVVIYDRDSEKLEQDENTNQFEDVHATSNKKVSISEKALEKSREIFCHIDDLKQNKQETVPVFQGFQTANNKKVQISKEALAKSRTIFQDDDMLEKECESIGFQTASNKKVIISEKALEKSRELFDDKAADELELEKNEGASVFRGFQTISNKAVSDEARSKRIFQDVDIFDKECDMVLNKIEQKEESNGFKGFQTASNKKVSISEKALERSRKIFDDIDTNDIKDENNGGTIMFCGFQTATNKKVKISNDALARSKQIFQDIDLFEKDSETISNKVEQEESQNLFKGFQTASNKKVNISEKALEKSRKLFDDCNGFKDEQNECTPVLGFQTASNKKVSISDKALGKSKKLFEDLNLRQLDRNSKTTVDSNNDFKNNIHEPVVEETFKDLQTASKDKYNVYEQTLAKTKDFKGIITPEVKKRIDRNVVFSNSEHNSKIDDNNRIERDVIDTQVLNDFQETLNTEDFCKSTLKSKRSGSPILSCPRAKKRKFEAPYRSHKKVEAKSIFVPPKLAKSYIFNSEYKKHKKYTLKDIERLDKELNGNKTATDPYIFEFNFDTLLNFEFINIRNDYTKGKIDVEELKKIFLGSVNKKIVPDGWLDNHIKLIIWKLLSYEIKYANVMQNICTVKNVLEQLKYRYDRELYHVQRPILRKVLEKDEVSSKTMVLCVAALYVDNVSITSVNTSSQNVELLLTDGWYCVKACTDRMLVRLLAKGTIVVGTKIAVCGAELVNCEQGIAPWEDISSVRLKLSGNSVRPCRWPSRLGLRAGLVRCALGAARADGGRLAAARVLIARVYPPLYVEKMEDGSTVTLSERLEQIRQMKHESEREAVMEKLYEEVEKEMSDQDSQDSEGYSNDRGCLDSGSQISRCMKRSTDPDEYRSNLTESQNRMLEEHYSKQREKVIERVRAKFEQKLKKNCLNTDRNVVPLLKVRVAGFSDKNGVQVTKGYLSIWKPSAAVLELVTEGAWIEMLNVIPTGIRNTEVQLSAGRQTVFNPYSQTNEKFNLYANNLRRKCYEIREITQNPSMATDYNEIDTVGMIFCIEPSTKEFDEKQSFQNVYLSDADKNIVCVNFWGGLKKFGFQNILDTGQIITCVNLQKRAGNTNKSIPHYRVTEFSYFTKTPKDRKALELTNELSNKLSKIRDKFCQDCMLLKSNYNVYKTRNNENISPYRFDYNVSKNIISPLRKCDVNLNLTGLDFESSFDSQEITPQALLRKKKINEKIEKIRLYYGEPPPLASIQMVNKSKNASATYKSPLISNSERQKNVNSEETPGLQNVASPMSMNRTYVKNINPLKLDFSSASNLNDSVDHFADDFEASPPLSLDSDVVI